MSIADHEIVTRIRAGDASAFTAVMRRENQRLYRAVRAILRDDAEAEDALQETYIRAYTHMASFREDARLSTWLVTARCNAIS